MNLELQKALERDRGKLLGLTGQDHGPGLVEDAELEAWIESLVNTPSNAAPVFPCTKCRRTYNKERVLKKHQARYNHFS